MQKYILAGIIIIGLSVGGYTFLEKDNTLKPIAQGISGKVQLRSGNCMPRTITDNPSSDNYPCKSSPVSRTIYIRHATNGLAFQRNPQQNLAPLVKKVRSNGDGQYRAELPSGSYSIFVEDEGQEYCNLTNGEGIACGVVVQNGITTYDLKINHAVD